MSNARYALYLIPPYPVARTVAEIHGLLQKQFGLQAAGRFQVHATLKGFFKKTPGPLAPLMQRLDTLFATQPPLTVAAEGLHRDAIGFGLDLTWLQGRRNDALFALRQQIVDVIRPFIAPDCDFVDADLGTPYRPHITLAFRDIPPDLYDDIVAWVQPGLPGPEPFLATTFHFLEFRSRQWDGAWWEDLTWQVLRAWDVSR
jgi:2'-5' RNA ligase